MNADNTVFLFLDDCRIPSDSAKYMRQRNIDSSIYLKNWIIVRSYNEFVEWIEQNGLPDVISFDHDLGNDLSGMDCAKWLINYCLDNCKSLPLYAVHSANPPGAANIEGLFKSFQKSI
ncbi:MAG: cyclic-phosphate processing receiver domain-containing protein [Bacteroidota bacterium]